MQAAPLRSAALASAVAALALAAPASAHPPTLVPIAGTITPGADGDCTPAVLSGPQLRWQCADATETYAGGLASTAEAIYEVRGSFNTRSGATLTRGTETFTGCVADACGTLQWLWHASFTTDAATATVLHGQGQARITAGTDELAGARGSFTIECLPEACAYDGHVLL